MTDEPTQPAAAAPEPDTVPKEQFYRLAADFDNYRKMMDRQLVDMSTVAAQNVVLAMVDVMDHMDHAVAHATDAVKADVEWFKGLQAIDAQFHDTLRQFGVERIETTGKPFSPATMEAVSQVAGGTSGTVQSEQRTGYTMHGRVIRPARVIIYE